MSFNVLVVADRDLCRGPLAAAVLRGQLELGPLRDGLRVVSRGLQASDEPVCAEAPEAGVSLAGHRPTLLSDADLGAADLILTVEAEQQRAVLALDPSARGRCFTITEAQAIADWLARGAPLPEGVEVMGAPVQPEGRTERVHWWVGEMDRSRGLPNLIDEVPRGLESAHRAGSVGHADSMADVIDTCSALGSALRQLLR